MNKKRRVIWKMDQQNHLFSLIAVFLALGIGILIGASMGENALVINQINLIEELQREIAGHREEIENYHSLLARFQEEINNWESLEEEYFNPLFFQNRLEGFSFQILVGEFLPAKVEEFLELTGCSYRMLTIEELKTAACYFIKGEEEDNNRVYWLVVGDADFLVSAFEKDAFPAACPVIYVNIEENGENALETFQKTKGASIVKNIDKIFGKLHFMELLGALKY